MQFVSYSFSKKLNKDIKTWSILKKKITGRTSW